MTIYVIFGAYVVSLDVKGWIDNASVTAVLRYAYET